MATKKLIDAREAKTKLRSVRDYFGGPPQTEQDKLARSVAKLCMDEVGKIKPVDAVEVVRCKDCDHRADKLDCGNYLCNRKMIGMVRPNDFCSFGERRTDNA